MKFKLHVISNIYINYLFIHDMKVYQNYPEEEKKIRPYFGPILLNNYNYYIPLCSFKEKHRTFKDSSELSKRMIFKDGYLSGVLNISNMIPVPVSQVQMIDFSTLPPSHAMTLTKQLRILTRDIEEILSKVEKCYSKVIVESPFHTKNCCKYLRLENVCNEFEEILKNR